MFCFIYAQPVVNVPLAHIYLTAKHVFLLDCSFGRLAFLFSDSTVGADFMNV